jgi:hypothetical protein
MIYRFVTGKLGTGKTLVSVGIAMEYLSRGATVATNVDFYPEHFPNKRSRNISIIRLPDHPDSAALKALGIGNPTLVQGPDGNYRPGPNYDPKANSSYCQIWCMGIKPRSCLIDPVLARRP